MADYCKQCAEYWGFEPDFKGATTTEMWKKGYAAVVLCEGCGAIQVDPEGSCVSTDCDCNGHKGGRETWKY